MTAPEHSTLSNLAKKSLQKCHLYSKIFNKISPWIASNQPKWRLLQKTLQMQHKKKSKWKWTCKGTKKWLNFKFAPMGASTAGKNGFLYFCVLCSSIVSVVNNNSGLSATASTSWRRLFTNTVVYYYPSLWSRKRVNFGPVLVLF